MDATQEMLIPTDEIRIEVVDAWHRDWPRVRDVLEHDLGPHHVPGEQDDGWLSARQNLIVAFLGERIVGHLSFHIDLSPRHSADEPTHLEAHIDSCRVDPVLVHRGIEAALKRSAYERVQLLHCDRTVGFDLSTWT